jgi:hypothetical protein
MVGNIRVRDYNSMKKDVIGVKECVRGKMEYHVSVDSITNHRAKKCSVA